MALLFPIYLFYFYFSWPHSNLILRHTRSNWSRLRAIGTKVLYTIQHLLEVAKVDSVTSIYSIFSLSSHGPACFARWRSGSEEWGDVPEEEEEEKHCQMTNFKKPWSSRDRHCKFIINNLNTKKFIHTTMTTRPGIRAIACVVFPSMYSRKS